jgi:S1-C subfamily serine protease
MLNLAKNIKKVSPSIIAIGFRPEPNKITIIGSGFAISNEGRILSSAHLYNKLKPEQIDALMGMAMIKQEPNGLNHYKWFPLRLMKKEDKNDIAVFQMENYKVDLLHRIGVGLELGDSEDVEVGEDVYFIGFPYAAVLINEGFGITLVVNKGIISNIKRDGTDPSRKRNWFIVDAISNPGNSGCPLIDLKTNKVIGIMAITWRKKSKTHQDLDIREPMHICAAKPINLAKDLLE